MELIVINDSQIKLTLTGDDLSRYPPDTRTGELFRRILRDAARMKSGEDGAHALPAGFSDAGSTSVGRLFVQVYPSRAGGCELFVTRLPEARAQEDEELPSPGRTARRTPALPRRSPLSSGPARRYIYVFERMDLMLRCCAGLTKLPGGSRDWASSAAYADPEKRTCYLILSEESPSVSEYLGSLCPDCTYGYIAEHCSVLCGDSAVVKLGELV